MEEYRDRNWGQEVSEVSTCQCMEGLRNEEENFVGDAGFDGEPVMVDDGGGDVLPEFGV